MLDDSMKKIIFEQTCLRIYGFLSMCTFQHGHSAGDGKEISDKYGGREGV